jgi:hypothetical protein
MVVYMAGKKGRSKERVEEKENKELLSEAYSQPASHQSPYLTVYT